MKDIMGIEIENMSAASAVRRIMGLLAREPLSVCTVLRADMLLLAEKDEEYREYLSQTALRIVGDAAILKAMGEERKDRLEELENHSFQTQLLKELSGNGRPVAVLTETEAEKEKTVENLKRNYPSLSLAGAFSMETSDDMDYAVNHINGLDAELVIAKLPPPEQEAFIFSNKGRLNIRLWLGLGQASVAGEKKEKTAGFLENLFIKRLFKKKVNQYQEEKN